MVVHTCKCPWSLREILKVQDQLKLNTKLCLKILQLHTYTKFRSTIKKSIYVGQWRHTPLIPELRKQRPVDLSEFRPAQLDTQRNPALKNKNKKKQKSEKSHCGPSQLDSSYLSSNKLLQSMETITEMHNWSNIESKLYQLLHLQCNLYS